MSRRVNRESLVVLRYCLEGLEVSDVAYTRVRR